ncbi:DUF1919 domain-containing protein [Flavobacteriaceae bacterium]|nr:DUF1919 domain-containing protein [Flavobacteriaceae bacterium]
MGVTIKGIIQKARRAIVSLKFKQIKNKEFTIICNNCWAGQIYQKLDIPYLTPTVGLFFYLPCYIKFLENFDFYLKENLIFIKISKYDLANSNRESNWYPIAKIDDVEIHFLHYKTEEEADNKWNNRKNRINRENFLVVGSERDLCDESIIRRFQKLPFKNKVFFTANKYNNDASLIHIKDYEKQGVVGDIYTENDVIHKYFNIFKWLNQAKH